MKVAEARVPTPAKTDMPLPFMAQFAVELMSSCYVQMVQLKLERTSFRLTFLVRANARQVCPAMSCVCADVNLGFSCGFSFFLVRPTWLFAFPLITIEASGSRSAYKSSSSTTTASVILTALLTILSLSRNLSLVLPVTLNLSTLMKKV